MSAPGRGVRIVTTALVVASIVLTVRAAATRADVARVIERASAERSAASRGSIELAGLAKNGDPQLLLDSLLAGFAAPDDAHDVLDRLVSAAVTPGVVVDSVEGGPAGREGRVAITGDPAGVIAWLRAAEREVIESGAVFRSLSVRTAGVDGLTATVAVVHPDPEAAPIATSATDRSEIFTAAAAWPAAPDERVARALTPAPDTTSGEAETADAAGVNTALSVNGSDTRPVVPRAPRFVGTVFVGTVGTGSPNYVFRFDESGVVRALTPGDRAYGWRLVEADRALFVFEHGGGLHESAR